MGNIIEKIMIEIKKAIKIIDKGSMILINIFDSTVIFSMYIFFKYSKFFLRFPVLSPISIKETYSSLNIGHE